jgi:hypothetical protein
LNLAFQESVFIVRKCCIYVGMAVTASLICPA